MAETRAVPAAAPAASPAAPASPAAEGAWERFWFGEASLVRLGAFRIVMLAAAFYGAWHFRIGVLQHADGVDVAWLAREWRPIYALEVLGIGPPGPVAARVVMWSLFAAIGLGIVGLATRLACLAVAVLAFYWIAVHYSFGKPHHDCIQLMFGLAALPLAPVGARLSVDSLLARLRRARAGGDPAAAPERAPWAALPLRVTQVSLALGYFFSGATKLVVSGPGWANGYTLQGIMLEYDSAWSEVFAERVWLCRLMQVGLLAVQATFPLIFLARWLRWVYVPGAIAFHLIAMQTMATGPFITLWFTLAAFVALERVPAFLGRNVVRAPLWRAVPLAAALGAFAWLTVALYFRHMPKALILLLLPLAVALVLGALPRLRLALRFDPRHAGARRAAAALEALDWSGRLALAPDADATAPLADARGRTGAAAWRAALARTTLGLLALPLPAPRSVGAREHAPPPRPEPPARAER